MSSIASISSSNSPGISRELLITAYLEAAVNYLTEKNQLNFVVLTDNSSAYHSLTYLLSKTDTVPENDDGIGDPLQAIIILNMQHQEPLTKNELESVFGLTSLPMLDIFFTADHLQQQAARKLHRAVAMRKKLENYQQVALNEQPQVAADDFQSFLVGRVRGFMQRNAQGIEMNKESPEDTKSLQSSK